MSLKRIFTKVTGIVMVAAVAVSAFAPMTVKASEETGMLIFSYEHDKADLEEAVSQGFIADLTNPNNQWIDTEEELKHFLGFIADDGSSISAPGFNGALATFKEKGTQTAESPYTTNTIFSLYDPFMSSNSSYFIDGIFGMWAPEGLKFHAANVANFEGTGKIIRSNMQDGLYRGYNCSFLLNQEGKEITHFERGINYIVNFVPVLYDENAYGLILRNMIEVTVMPYEEAVQTGFCNDGSLTKELVNQYILAEEY